MGLDPLYVIGRRKGAFFDLSPCAAEVEVLLLRTARETLSTYTESERLHELVLTTG